MFTWGSKFFFGTFAAAFVGALVYGLTTGGGPVGVLSYGYKGGVGDHAGYTLLMSVAWISLLLGVISVLVRDGDAEDMAIVAGVEDPIAVRPPSGPAVAAPLTAVGIGCLALSLAVGQAFLFLGIAIIGVAAIDWMIQAWSERVTGDPRVNSIIRNRILGPIQIPMFSLVGVAAVAIAMSRVMLAVSKTGAVIAASAAALFIFLSAVMIAKSKAPRPIVSAIVSFGVVAVLAGGVIGAVAGEREGESHGEELEELEEESLVGEGE